MPVLERDRRAALAAEERAYWTIVISAATSLSLVLALAARASLQLHAAAASPTCVIAARIRRDRAARSEARSRTRAGLADRDRFLWRSRCSGVAVPSAVGITSSAAGSRRLRERRAIQIAQRGTLVVHDPGDRGRAGVRARPLLSAGHEPRRAIIAHAVHGVLHPRPRYRRRRQPVPARVPGVDRDRLRARRPDRARGAFGVWGVLGLIVGLFRWGARCSAAPRRPPRRCCSR